MLFEDFGAELELVHALHPGLEDVIQDEVGGLGPESHLTEKSQLSVLERRSYVRYALQ